MPMDIFNSLVNSKIKIKIKRGFQIYITSGKATAAVSCEFPTPDKKQLKGRRSYFGTEFERIILPCGRRGSRRFYGSGSVSVRLLAHLVEGQQRKTDAGAQLAISFPLFIASVTKLSQWQGGHHFKG